jgi:hypothetical protein
MGTETYEAKAYIGCELALYLVCKDHPKYMIPTSSKHHPVTWDVENKAIIHFYSDPLEIYSLDWQERRLGVVRAIADAGVPCVVWAEDALAFAQCSDLAI